MEIAILIIIIIVLLVAKSSLSSQISDINNKLDEIKKELRQRDHQTMAQQAYKQIDAKPSPVAAPKPVEESKPAEEPKPIAPETEAVPAPKVAATRPSEPVIQQTQRAAMPSPKPEPKPKPVQKSFFERHPDLEKFIGENLINKIGIGILVLGVAIFVKYAIDQDWIGPIGRVMIGILSGGILIGTAHYLKTNYKAFSSVLLGGGIAILYFTISIAFHLYGIFSQSVAFGLLILITIFTVIFSILYNRMEIAILAILGGFGSPFMVSTGAGNYAVLFSYLIVLNSGMLILAYFRKWYPINIICYALTIILFTGWFSKEIINAENAPYLGALLFASIFFVIFFFMNIIYSLSNKQALKPLDYGIILTNTLFYFSAGLYVVNKMSDGAFTGLFTAFIGVFFFVCAFVLYKNKNVDKNLIYLLTGLILTFLSLTAPIQLKGNHITLFWAAEAVLLLWLSQRSGLSLLKKTSAIITLLMLISLIMDWKKDYAIDPQAPLSVIFNKAFLTGIIASTSLGLSRLLLKMKEHTQTALIQDISKALLIIFTVVSYCTFLFELIYQLQVHNFPLQYISVACGTYTSAFLILVIVFARSKNYDFMLKPAVVISILNFIWFVALQNGHVSFLRNAYILGEAPLSYFLVHWANIAAIIVLIYLNIPLTARLQEQIGLPKYVSHISSLLFIIFIISSQLDHIIVLLNASDMTSIKSSLVMSHKAGYPIAWGVFSFVLMIFGMKKKQRHLRFASLALFLVTILKLFIYDIKNASEGGKIAAFISLGVILLIISFMYQKLKVLLLDNKTDNAEIN